MRSTSDDHRKDDLGLPAAHHKHLKNIRLWTDTSLVAPWPRRLEHVFATEPDLSRLTASEIDVRRDPDWVLFDRFSAEEIAKLAKAARRKAAWANNHARAVDLNRWAKWPRPEPLRACPRRA